MVNVLNSNAINLEDENSVTIFMYDVDLYEKLRPKYKMAVVKGYATEWAKGTRAMDCLEVYVCEYLKSNKKKLDYVVCRDSTVLKIVLEKNWISVKDAQKYLEKVVEIENRTMLLEYIHNKQPS
jgi:hypothetical protein